MGKKKYVLAIDQSTQGTKAILFDQDGQLFCRTNLPHRQIVNDRGWVSHNLEEIYGNTIQVIKDVVDKAGIDKAEIACLGINNQRETSAAWERKTGRPLAHAIVWQCSRAENICERIKNNVLVDPERKSGGFNSVSDIIRWKTGLNLSAYFPAAKYAWLQENMEEVKQAKKKENLCFGTIDSYLLYRLTGGKAYATDYSNASRTQLYNIHTLEWDSELCNWFGIRTTELPEVRNSNADFGMTDVEGYFTHPIPICGVLGDSQAALFGQGCIEPGMVKATYGTGSSVMMNMGTEYVMSQKGLVTSLAWGIDGTVNYVLEGNINYTGSVISWLKDDIELIESPSETEALAREANTNDMTYLVPAFSGLGAPYWHPEAKAMIYGMSRTTGKREIVRAALDSIAYQIADVIHAMQDERKVLQLRVDGGSSKNSYLMQFQSDILGVEVRLSKCEESSASGAAYMAGLSIGLYDKKSIFAEANRECFHPIMTEQKRKEKYEGWKDAIKKVI